MPLHDEVYSSSVTLLFGSVYARQREPALKEGMQTTRGCGAGFRPRSRPLAEPLLPTRRAGRGDPIATARTER
jgi:hypothetical protein